LRAAAEGISGVNAAMAYGTDGELAALGLTALCDDKGAQIVYAPAPVVYAPAATTPPAGVQAFRDEFGFRYDGQGNRIDAQGNIISPQSTRP